MNSTVARAASIVGLMAVATVSTSGYWGPGRVVATAGPLTSYADPYGDGTPNSTDGGTAGVFAFTDGGKTVVELRVKGLAPNHTYGAHAHALACNDNQAGGHYQNVPGESSSTNEIWLDFTTDSEGQGSARTTVDWVIRTDGANAVVIHDHMTDLAGKAGPKLGCLDVDF